MGAWIGCLTFRNSSKFETKTRRTRLGQLHQVDHIPQCSPVRAVPMFDQPHVTWFESPSFRICFSIEFNWGTYFNRSLHITTTGPPHVIPYLPQQCHYSFQPHHPVIQFDCVKSAQLHNATSHNLQFENAQLLVLHARLPIWFQRNSTLQQLSLEASHFSIFITAHICLLKV